MCIHWGLGIEFPHTSDQINVQRLDVTHGRCEIESLQAPWSQLITFLCVFFII